LDNDIDEENVAEELNVLFADILLQYDRVLKGLALGLLICEKDVEKAELLVNIFVNVSK
jgi:hypothetical protein